MGRIENIEKGLQELEDLINDRTSEDWADTFTYCNLRSADKSVVYGFGSVLIFSWSGDIGFGEVVLVKNLKTGEVECDDECKGRAFVEGMLLYWSRNAIIKNEFEEKR